MNTLIVGFIMALFLFLVWAITFRNRGVTNAELVIFFMIFVYGLAKSIEFVLVWVLGG